MTFRSLFLPRAFMLSAALLLGACSSPEDPEQQIRDNIAAMQTALAERDNSGFREHLAESFIGAGRAQRTMYKDDVQKMLAGYFLRYKEIKILVTLLSVELDEVQPGLATTNATVALAGGQRGMPDSARLYKVNGQWQNFDGEWKMTRFEWK